MSAAQVPNADRLVLRWTIGNVRQRGFELLRLSIASAFRLFGPDAIYLVCVNSLPAAVAQAKTGELPVPVQWRAVTPEDVPTALRSHLDGSLIEGMGWKLAPLRTHHEQFELALDNDCILWELPTAMRQWLESENGCLLAEDAERCMGSFDPICPAGAFNVGIRGLPPNTDLEAALHQVLAEATALNGEPLQLTEEIEEQGLQAAAIFKMPSVFVVAGSEVSICSPFWPRSPELGVCGAHFVGMNAAHLDWDYYDRPADLWLDDHWERHRPALYEKAGLSIP